MAKLNILNKIFNAGPLILLYYLSISEIDTNLEKAALVDGASPIRTFIKIKMPQIYPVIAYLLIINLIGSFKVYEEVVAFYGANAAGVDNSGMTMVYYVFQKLSLSKFELFIFKY